MFDNPFYFDIQPNTSCNCLQVKISNSYKVLPFVNGTGISPLGLNVTQSGTGYTCLASAVTIYSGSFAAGNAIGFFECITTDDFPGIGDYSWTGGSAVCVRPVFFKTGSGITPLNYTVTQSSTLYTGVCKYVILHSPPLTGGSFVGGNARGVMWVQSANNFPNSGTYSWSVGTAADDTAYGTNGINMTIKNLNGFALAVLTKNSSNIYVLDYTNSDLTNPYNRPNQVWDVAYSTEDSLWYVPMPTNTSYKLQCFSLPTKTIESRIGGAVLGIFTNSFNSGNLYYENGNFYEADGLGGGTLLSINDYSTFLSNYSLPYPPLFGVIGAFLIEETGIMSCFDYTDYSYLDRFVVSATCCYQQKVTELINYRKLGDQAYKQKLYEAMALMSYIKSLQDLDTTNSCMTDSEINSIKEKIDRICCTCC